MNTILSWINGIVLADFGQGDGNADIGFAVGGLIYGGLGIDANREVRREIYRYVPELE
ncbi:MAG: hypothetical protein OEQ53_20640 [Saprospiraceae bacterium]|nr:hypothetical protein [Saprospiraceae bacterium]